MKNIGCLGFAWKRLSCKVRSVRLAPVRGVLAGLAVLLFSAGAPYAGEGKPPLQDHPERRGLGLKLAGQSATNTEATPGRDVSAAPTIVWGRSLFVRTPALLKEISFTAVMDQLVTSSNGKIADRNELFRKWWSTAAGDECEELRPKQPNGPPFPYDCSRAEGMLKDKDPYTAFGDDETPPFIIIAAVNRVDLLRDPLGGDCGEFRIVAGKHRDWKNPVANVADAPDGINGEMLIAFEAVMPNGGKPESCMAIQKFWLSLSEGPEQGQRLEDRDQEVANLLRKFFLEGITLAENGSVVDGDAVSPATFQLPPAMHVDHLGASASSTGQIRTNSKLHQGQWGLREYRFDKESMRLLPTRTTGSPEPTLFSRNSPDSDATAKLVELVAKSIRTEGSAPGTLLIPNINSFHLPGLPEHLLAAEMNGEEAALGDYAEILHSEGHPALIGEIEGAVRALTAEQIRKRIQSLSCAGCHQFSNRGRGGFEDDFKHPVCWQVSSTNKHVTTELDLVTGDYKISEALKFVFLPHREFVMRRYLAGKYEMGAYLPGNAPDWQDMSEDAKAAEPEAACP